MASIREQILAAILERLNTERPDGIPAATRTRLSLFNADALPAINVYPAQEKEDRIGGNLGLATRRKLSIHIDCIGLGELPDQQIDPMLVWCNQRLNGQKLGGLVNALERQSVVWQYDNAEYDYVIASVQLLADYSIKTGDEETSL